MHDELGYIPERNAFDGCYRGSESVEMGFIDFKKAGKWIKKSAKKVGKVAKKIVKAPINAVKKIAKRADVDFIQAAKWTGATTKDLAKKADVDFIQAGKWAGKNPLATAAILAGGGALAFGGGPLLMAGIKGAGSMAANGAGMLAAGAKAAGPAVASLAPKIMSQMKQNAVGPEMPPEQYQQQTGQNAQVYAEQHAQQILNNAEQTGVTPEYLEAVQRLRAQGYSDAQIAQQWITSQSYYKQALPQVQQLILPELMAEYRAAGTPNADAQAHVDAEYVAQETLRDVQRQAKGFDPGQMIIPATILGAVMLLKN